MDVPVVEIISNKGFYVGDLCYVLPRELYFGVWGNKYNFDMGKIKDPKTNLDFAVGDTAHGDGCYYGTNGKQFPVDSGTIGIAPLEMILDYTEQFNFEIQQLGYFVHVPGKASFEEAYGVFTIHLPNGEIIIIDTGA